MIHESRTIDETIDFLNALLALDEGAVRALVEQRVPCNRELENHPSVQVQTRDGTSSVGLLGILNGLFGADDTGWGAITAVFEDDGTLTKFERTKR